MLINTCQQTRQDKKVMFHLRTLILYVYVHIFCMPLPVDIVYHNAFPEYRNNNYTRKEKLQGNLSNFSKKYEENKIWHYWNNEKICWLSIKVLSVWMPSTETLPFIQSLVCVNTSFTCMYLNPFKVLSVSMTPIRTLTFTAFKCE